jgi:hypothetical protein
METKQAWAYLVALAVPFVVGFLAKCSWPSWSKFTITVILSAAIGLVTIRITTNTWGELTLPFIVSLIGASEVYFRIFVDGTGIKEWLASHFNKDKNEDGTTASCPPN